MLKVEIAGKEIKRIEVEGTSVELAAEIGYMAHAIYNMVRQSDLGAAEKFRMAVTVALLPASPAWEKKDVMTGAQRAECIVVTIPKRKKD